MAKERGIRRIKGELIKRNKKGEICGACALGMAMIAKLGTETVADDYGMFDVLFPNMSNNGRNKCLLKTVAPNHTNHVSDLSDGVVEFVYTLNDRTKLTPEEIAKKLEKCNL